MFIICKYKKIIHLLRYILTNISYKKYFIVVIQWFCIEKIEK
jgi:hypothetical protein